MFVVESAIVGITRSPTDATTVTVRLGIFLTLPVSVLANAAKHKLNFMHRLIRMRNFV